MSIFYDFQEAGEELKLSYSEVTRRCRDAGYKLRTGRHGKKYLNQKQLDDLKAIVFMNSIESTGYKVEIIRITETYHIYHSKMNFT